MMTLDRLKAFSDSYGADLRRWPADLGRDAELLLQTSDEARQIMAAAAETDAMLDAMSRAEQTALWSGPEEAEAFARLRASVAARIAQDGSAERPRGLGALLHSGFAVIRANLGWFSLAASSGVAIAGGILIGSISPQFRPPDDVLSLLQITPFHTLPL